MDIRGVDISDMEIDDNKDYYEVICWGVSMKMFIFG